MATLQGSRNSEYNVKVNKIRLLIEKRRYTDALMLITSSLEELMKGRYSHLYAVAPEAKRLEMDKIKDGIAKGRTDDKIGLGQWIGIYRGCKLFAEDDKITNETNLNKINSTRLDGAHPTVISPLSADGVNFAFMILVNSIKSLGHEIEPKTHKLCELCLRDKKEKIYEGSQNKKWGVCSKCYKITLGMKSLMEKHENKIRKSIFSIRILNTPALREKYKEYLTPDKKNYLESRDYFHEKFNSGLRPDIETKKEERIRLKEEKKAKERATVFENWEKEAQEKVYKEPTQNEIFKKLYAVVGACHDGDMLESLLGSDIIIPMLYEETGIVFFPKNKRIFSDSSFSQKEYEELERILAGHTIYNDFIKHMSIFEAICDILRIVLKYYESVSEMEETLIHGYLPIVGNFSQLKDFLGMFKK